MTLAWLVEELWRLYLLIDSFMISGMVIYGGASLCVKGFVTCYMVVSRNIKIHRLRGCSHQEVVQRRRPFDLLQRFGIWAMNLVISLEFLSVHLLCGNSRKYRSQLGPPTELGFQPLRSQWDNDIASAVKISVSVTWRGMSVAVWALLWLLGGGQELVYLCDTILGQLPPWRKHEAG